MLLLADRVWLSVRPHELRGGGGGEGLQVSRSDDVLGDGLWLQ